MFHRLFFSSASQNSVNKSCRKLCFAVFHEIILCELCTFMFECLFTKIPGLNLKFSKCIRAMLYSNIFLLYHSNNSLRKMLNGVRIIILFHFFMKWSNSYVVVILAWCVTDTCTNGCSLRNILVVHLDSWRYNTNSVKNISRQYIVSNCDRFKIKMTII